MSKISLKEEEYMSFFNKHGVLNKVLNTAFNASFANKTRVLGSLKTIFSGFKKSNPGKVSLINWAHHYNSEHQGKERIMNSVKMTQNYLLKIRDVLNELTENDDIFSDVVKDYIKQAVYADTYIGFLCESKIIEDIAKELGAKEWRLSNAEEETEGIDGFIDGVPYQVKPRSFRDNDYYMSRVNGVLVQYSLKDDLIDYKIIRS